MRAPAALRKTVFVASTASTLAMTVMSVACGPAATGAPASSPETSPSASSSAAALESADLTGFARAEFKAQRSDRLGVTFLLPNKEQWTVTDRADALGGWLVATHAGTHSTVRMKRFEETVLVGRRECEEVARSAHEMPNAASRAGWEVLADAPLVHPKGWDGWRLVALETRGADTIGHAFLITGRAHSCLVLHIQTMASAADPRAQLALADRLELLDARVLSTVAPDRAEMPAGMVPLPGEK